MPDTFLYAWRRDFGWDLFAPVNKLFDNLFLYAWRRDFGWDPMMRPGNVGVVILFLYAWRRDFGWDLAA